MKKFRYTIINKEDNQLQGTIGAPDEISAREELNNLGFSIIELRIVNKDEETQQKENQLDTFEFSAIDKAQKKIIGTIKAKNKYTAFKKLIKEYEFEVEYLYSQDLPEKDKEKEKKIGAYQLYNKYNDEEKLKLENKKNNQKDIEEFKQKQKNLLEQLNFVLEKVNKILNTYNDELKSNIKAEIKQKVEKILRIKNSTNLNYIKTSIEELLNFLQKEELFLNEEQRKKEKTQLKIEMQSLMNQVHKNRSRPTINITENLKNWQKTHITNNQTPSSLENFINSLIKIILPTPNIELDNLKTELKQTNNQIKQYILLYIKAPSKEFKKETKSGLKKLWQKRKNILQKIKTKKQEIKNKQILSIQDTKTEKLIKEIISLTGWLLTFYLIYYFASLYITTKELGIKEIPYIFNIYNSAFLKYFLITIFLIQTTLSIKLTFFKRNKIANLMIIPIFLISILLITLNL